MATDATPLDAFIPVADARERFATVVKAPAPLVMATASDFDLYSIAPVRWVFRLRERIVRAPPSPPRQPQGLLAEMQSLGWALLQEEPGRVVVCGAACQPWASSVIFKPVPPRGFAAYDAPGEVKIAWTLEVESRGPDRTLFAHETRAVATDETARQRFRRYWHWARFGIVGIRLLLLPAVRRAAERRHRERRGLT